MTIYCINLPKDTERRAFQLRQMRQLSLSFEFVDATSIETIDKAFIDAHRDDWERPLRAVEMACYLSHHKLWQRIAREKTPALILEDDILLSSRLPSLLRCCENYTDIEMIDIETTGRKKLLSNSPVTRCDTIVLHELFLDRNGSGAYILYPDGAAKLLHYADRKGIALADAHLNRTPMRVVQSVPALAVQADQASSVGLDDPLHTQSNIFTTKADLPRKRIRHLPKRIASQLSQGFRHLTHLFDAQKIEVKVEKEDFVHLYARRP